MKTGSPAKAEFLNQETATADLLDEYLRRGLLAIAVCCKDCVYWKYNGGTCGRIYRPDGFCSEGLQKEEQ